jgi:hypothetical protein
MRPESSINYTLVSSVFIVALPLWHCDARDFTSFRLPKLARN